MSTYLVADKLAISFVLSSFQKFIFEINNGRINWLGEFLVKILNFLFFVSKN